MTQKDFQYALRFHVSARVAEYFLFIAHSELVRFISRCSTRQEKVLISLPLLLLPIRDRGDRRGKIKRKSHPERQTWRSKSNLLACIILIVIAHAYPKSVPNSCRCSMTEALNSDTFFSNKWLEQEEVGWLPPATLAKKKAICQKFFRLYSIKILYYIYNIM